MSNAAVFRTGLPIWLPRVLPFACYIVFLAVAPLFATCLPDPRWMYAGQVGAVALTLLAFRHGYGELWRPAVSLSLPVGTWSVLVGAAVFIAWINLDLPYLNLGNGAGFDPRAADGSIDIGLVVIRIAGAALVVPVMEELFWRSLLMRWLEQRGFLDLQPGRVGWRGIWLSSLVFGFEHGLWFAGVVAGLCYAYLYRRSGTLWAPIIAHAVTNLLLGCWIVHSGNWQYW